jgi:hypothetical protein
VPWPGVRASGLVEAARRLADQVTRQRRDSRVSAPLSARPVGEAVRSQWGSEHPVHGLLDVAFGDEDRRGRVGQAAEHFAVLRRLARHLLQQEPAAPCGLTAQRLTAGWRHDYLLKVLAG